MITLKTTEDLRLKKQDVQEIISFDVCVAKISFFVDHVILNLREMREAAANSNEYQRGILDVAKKEGIESD